MLNAIHSYFAETPADAEPVKIITDDSGTMVLQPPDGFPIPITDEGIEACGKWMSDAITKDKLEKAIKNKKIGDLLSTGFKQSVGSLDAHAWIEKPDGTILDFDFTEYNEIRRLWACDNPRPFYAPNDAYLPAMRRICKKMVNTAKRVLPDVYPNAEAFYRDFYEEPKAGHCFMNATAYKFFNPQCKLKVGSMGWVKKRTGTIHWEFGNACMAWKPRRAIEKYPPNNKPIDLITENLTEAREGYYDEYNKMPDGFMDAQSVAMKRMKNSGGAMCLFAHNEEEEELMDIFARGMATFSGATVHHGEMDVVDMPC